MVNYNKLTSLPGKVLISVYKNIFDYNGNILLSGNYYFIIKKYSKGKFFGRITDNQIEFIFSSKQIMIMMAHSQSQLCRLSNVNELDILDYLSITRPIPEDQICVICLNNFKGQYITELDCKHNFHTSCITTWFNHEEKPNKTCPICRTKQKKCGKIKDIKLDRYMINPLYNKLNRFNI